MKLDIDINIGQIIKKGLQHKGWTQKDLAQAMKVSQGLVHAWTKNDRTPQADDLIKIALLLNITPDLFPNHLRKKFLCTNLDDQLSEVKKKVENVENTLCG